jgi:hypothetical protein
MRRNAGIVFPVVAGLCLVLSFATRVAGQEQPLLYTVPFKAGDRRYLIYRIPALWTAEGKPLLASISTGAIRANISEPTPTAFPRINAV